MRPATPPTADPPVALADDPVADQPAEGAFEAIVARLSKLSVDKHFDAYADVDWAAPDMQVDPHDPRWETWPDDPVAATDWYRALSPEDRSAYGLHRIVANAKIGWHFENLLQRGLLVRAMRLSEGAPELRYIHHEIIEESQHTLMFQELVRRSGLPVEGMPWWARIIGARAVSLTARYAPVTFFFLVLGGEDPIDHVQRRVLQHGRAHPLAERIIRIHVTEEARHISFARSYLRQAVPRLGGLRRRVVAVEVPVLMGFMARLMLEPPPDVRRHCGLPGPVARRAMRSPQGRALLADSVRKVRRLCDELGLMTPAARAVWRAVGLAG